MKTVISLALILVTLLCVTSVALAQVDSTAMQNKYASLMRAAQVRLAFLESILLPGDTLVVSMNQGSPRAQTPTQVFKLPLSSSQKSTYYTPLVVKARNDVNKWSDSLKVWLP